MNAKQLKPLYMFSCFVLCLIIALPTIALISVYPTREQFMEFWLLGKENTADGHPFNVESEVEYSVVVGVSNHMGCLGYHIVYVKLHNNTHSNANLSSSEVAPNKDPRLYEIQFLSRNAETHLIPVTFKLQNVTHQRSSVHVSSITFNGVDFPVDTLLKWNSDNNAFYVQLFFELWIHDVSERSFQFTNRTTAIWLNVTG